MFLYDMPLEALAKCRLPQTKEPDFEAFWERKLDESRRQPLCPGAEKMAYAVPEVRVERVSCEAFDGGRLVGFCITPADIQPRPTLIFYHGYTGHKGTVANYLMWALQGFTCIAFDVRGQGGESSDDARYPGGGRPGWLTKGILDPNVYYMVRSYVDAVRIVDFAAQREDVDMEHLGVTGVSQGGGLSLSTASLDGRVRLCMSEVPGFCHFGRSLEITQEAPWTELTTFIREHPRDYERVMRTLSYVELNNFTDRIQCPAIISVGHLDALCVPSSIFSAYNRLEVKDRHLEYVPYAGHEGGLMTEQMVAWARRHLL